MTAVYPAPPALVPPTRRSTRGAKVLTFSGALLLVVAIVALVIGVSTLASLAQSASTSDSTNGFSFTAADRTFEVDLTSNTTYMIVADLTSEDSSSTQARRSDFTVSSPVDDPIAVEATSEFSYLDSTDELSVIGKFTTTEAGNYYFEVDPGVPGSESFLVLDHEELRALGSQMIRGGVALAIAAILGFLGFLMVVGGIVWWVVRVKSHRPQPPYGYPQAGYPQGGYPQGGYPQGGGYAPAGYPHQPAPAPDPRFPSHEPLRYGTPGPYLTPPPPGAPDGRPAAGTDNPFAPPPG